MRLPDGHEALFPYLMVRDAPGLVRFVREVFDAEELGRTEQEGRLANARLQIGGVGLMVSEASDFLGAVPAALYVYVDDVDARHASALGAGGEELFAPDDMPYGDRQSGVRDPFGNVWFISTRLVDGGFHD